MADAGTGLCVARAAALACGAVEAALRDVGLVARQDLAPGRRQEGGGEGGIKGHGNSGTLTIDDGTNGGNTGSIIRGFNGGINCGINGRKHKNHGANGGINCHGAHVMTLTIRPCRRGARRRSPRWPSLGPSRPGVGQAAQGRRRNHIAHVINGVTLALACVCVPSFSPAESPTTSAEPWLTDTTLS